MMAVDQQLQQQQQRPGTFYELEKLLSLEDGLPHERVPVDDYFGDYVQGLSHLAAHGAAATTSGPSDGPCLSESSTPMAAAAFTSMYPAARTGMAPQQHLQHLPPQQQQAAAVPGGWLPLFPGMCYPAPIGAAASAGTPFNMLGAMAMGGVPGQVPALCAGYNGGGGPAGACTTPKERHPSKQRQATNREAQKNYRERQKQRVLEMQVTIDGLEAQLEARQAVHHHNLKLEERHDCLQAQLARAEGEAELLQWQQQQAARGEQQLRGYLPTRDSKRAAGTGSGTEAAAAGAAAAGAATGVDGSGQQRVQPGGAAGPAALGSAVPGKSANANASGLPPPQQQHQQRGRQGQHHWEQQQQQQGSHALSAAGSAVTGGTADRGAPADQWHGSVGSLSSGSGGSPTEGGSCEAAGRASSVGGSAGGSGSGRGSASGGDACAVVGKEATGAAATAAGAAGAAGAEEGGMYGLPPPHEAFDGLLSRFQAQVTRVKQFLEEQRLRGSNPSSLLLCPSTRSQLLVLIQESLGICRDLLRVEGVDVIDLLQRQGEASMGASGAAPGSTLRQKWLHVIQVLQLSPEQRQQLVLQRSAHLALMRRIYHQRQQLNMQAMSLMLLLPSSPFAGSGGGAGGSSGGSGQHLYHGGAAHGGAASRPRSGGVGSGVNGAQAAQLATVLRLVKENLRREQRAAMEINSCTLSRILTPVQAALYVCEAFPLHCDALSMCNVLSTLGSDNSVSGAGSSGTPGHRTSALEVSLG